MSVTDAGRAPPRRAAATGGRPLARVALVASAIVLSLTAVLCTAAVGVTAGLLAPLLGPWGGLAIGHHDCTMATVWPEVTWGLVALGVAAALSIPLARWRWSRALPPALFTLWLVGWCWAAVLSLINASS